jgi:two-component system nitrate/nitrite response regulator NarL
MPMQLASMDGNKFRVVVVAEQDMLATALATALVEQRDVRVRIPTPDPRAAIALLNRGMAQVAVVDLDRLDGTGLSIVSTIRDATGMPVLAATLDTDPEIPARALAAGSCGMLPAGDRGEAIADAIRRAADGGLVLPDIHLPAMVERLRRPVDRFASLTPREREILDLITKGLSTSELAAKLGISTGTVQVHVKNLLSKLGVHSKVQALRLALLAPPDPALASRSA